MARRQHSMRLFRQIVQFSRENRMYWLVPLFLFLAVAAVVVVIGQVAAPLLYTLF